MRSLMARANNNKYTSINFNHILEKNVFSASTPSPGKAKYLQNQQQHPSSYFSSYSSISSPSNAKTHGGMLVLTRPTTKPLIESPPLSPPTEAKQHQQTQQVQLRLVPDQEPKGSASDQISLRPLGRTGSVLAVVPNQEREKEVIGSGPGSPKPDRFVPPHLRPGFVGREERPGPEVHRGRESVQRHFGSPGQNGENGWPKSGGHERRRRVCEADLGLMMGRPRSSGSRPSSSACKQ